MRLIDADKLLEMRFTEGIIDGGELLVSFNDVVSTIRQAPTVDAVEVVRCKDCIYNHNGGCTHSEIYDDTNYRPDYYCADGERRKNES